MALRLQDRKRVESRSHAPDGWDIEMVFEVPLDFDAADASLPAKGAAMPGYAAALLGPFVTANASVRLQRGGAAKEVVIRGKLLKARI